MTAPDQIKAAGSGSCYPHSDTCFRFMASHFAIPALWPINEFFAFHQGARCDRHSLRRGHCPKNLEK